MLFSSIVFLWVFLPIVIIINYLFNLIFKDEKKRIQAKNTFLLIASLFFYAWGGIYFLSIMIFSIIINFLGGYVISKLGDKQRFLKGLALFVTILLNILNIGYFKYFNMIVIIIEQAMAKSSSESFLNNILYMRGTGTLGFEKVILPIGISFFTFQAMSYVIDVYRKEAQSQKNIFDFALYVSLFPQLIAGPIVRYSDVALQINGRVETLDKFTRGIKRFCYGLGKKVLLANTFALVVDRIWELDLSNIGFLIALLVTISYAMQIYYDFSGYSDMAIGLGLMFGFEFKENFNYPYMSLSITEFWRRWHISLSTWFKEYVYIPLGGNRQGMFRTYLNLMIAFLLTGIWHGANFTFIIWGITYGIIQIIEKLFLYRLLQMNKFKIINWLYTFIVATLLFVVFRSNNIFEAGTVISQFANFNSKYNIMTYLSMKFIITLLIAILSMGILQSIFNKVYEKVKNNFVVHIIDASLQLIILMLSILSIVDGTYNPFIYFQF
ncbi:MAG: MBOAT family protein [Lachnospiraceae bacterium]|nr:MBOAT family protein [Lachnospiraceae bacterium]